MTDKAISGTDSRKDDRLLPCPFCGKDAIVVRNAFDSCVIYHIECTGCLAEHARYMGSREAAIEAWNKRAERTCRIVKTWSDSDYVDGWRYRCSECMCFIPVNERDLETGEVINAANYCPNCGAKVVSE